MTTECPAIVLRREKRGTFLARHPWVLNKSVARTPGGVANGAVVDLVMPDGQWIARGVYNANSRILVRLYTWNRDEALDTPFWHRRLETAIELREQLGLMQPDGAARLVFSEADGLSGLIVDSYAGHLVVQFTAMALELRAAELLDWLKQRLQPKSIQVRVDQRVARAEGLTVAEGCLVGEVPAEPVLIEEHGVRLQVDLREGQKTGYYLDQRDNRRQAASYLAGRSVLDVCTYVGGFALAAARGGATRVLGIDTSQRAVDQARLHADLNQFSQVEFATGDCFETLERLGQEGQRFGGVVLDPPRFAGSRQSINQALQAYHRLNRLAMQVLEPGGILVTCSCSGLVTRDDFRQVLVGAARKTGRDLELLEQRGAAPDHPVRLSCPETEYLKCVVARVL